MRSELKLSGAKTADKRRMIELLGHSDDRPIDPMAALAGEGVGDFPDGTDSSDNEVDGDGDEGNSIEEPSISPSRAEALRSMIHDGNLDALSLDALSLDEKQAFLRAVTSAPVPTSLASWQPWWFEPLDDHRRSVTQLGKPLITELPSDHDGVAVDASAELEDTSQAMCVCVESDPTLLSKLPRFASLTRGAAPSPLLPVLLLDILYSYAHTCRLYLGDLTADPPDAAAVLLAVSRVLSSDARPESVTEACAGCMEASLATGVRLTTTPDRSLAYAVLSDVLALTGQPHYAVDALGHALRCVEAAAGEEAAVERAPNEPPAVTRRRKEGLRQLQACARKLTYYLSWARDCGDKALTVQLAAPREAVTQLLRDHAQLQQEASKIQRNGPSGGSHGAKRPLQML